ncbi:hypothetical protein ABZ249_16255 [Nocardiopsis sp. NPDC006139]|uniref:hypothetical protein n=1 Tax=Nocardiopsis sp. NPDC006139 TaxID=3154578 RepID=UPI0033B6E9CC
MLLWSEEGTLELVGVQVPWHRKGATTALWHQAHGIFQVPLDKAPIRTALGEAWLQSLDIDALWKCSTPP